MNTRLMIRPLWFSLLLSPMLWTGCSTTIEPKTSQQFIDCYTKAFQQKDVDAILALQPGLETLKKTPMTPTVEEELKNYSPEKEREKISKDLEREGFGYIAWTNTSYVSDIEHDDHIHVKVKVNFIDSEIVLVKENGVLKIHPWPSAYLNR